MLPPRLAKELDDLSKNYRIDIVETPDFIHLLFLEFPTAPHFNNPTTTLLLRVPRAYPDAGLDMFWTDAGLTLDNGTVPQSADSIEEYNGRRWRRFSWHHNGWNPNIHNLHTYIVFVRRRFNAR